MKILYSNVDSLPNKLHELLIYIGMFNPDVLMITEVLPKSEETITTKESINISGFELFTNIDKEKIYEEWQSILNHILMQQKYFSQKTKLKVYGVI